MSIFLMKTVVALFSLILIRVGVQLFMSLTPGFLHDAVMFTAGFVQVVFGCIGILTLFLKWKWK